MRYADHVDAKVAKLEKVAIYREVGAHLTKNWK